MYIHIIYIYIYIIIFLHLGLINAPPLIIFLKNDLIYYSLFIYYQTYQKYIKC